MHHHAPPIEDIEEFKSVEELANSTKVYQSIRTPVKGGSVSGCLGLDSVQMPHSQSVRCIRCHKTLREDSAAVRDHGIQSAYRTFERLQSLHITAIRDFAQFRPRGTWSSRARVILKDGSAKGSVCMRSSRRNPR